MGGTGGNVETGGDSSEVFIAGEVGASASAAAAAVGADGDVAVSVSVSVSVFVVVTAPAIVASCRPCNAT